nr:HAMP domain-containing methyl-accepting chemotaxis protein [uncultured Gellertiella sp.]
MSTISSKIILVSLTTFALGAAATCGGIWTERVLTANVQESVRVDQAVRTHMNADMMHDAIRADVFSALLALSGAPGVTVQDADANLTDHSKVFTDSIALNKQLVTQPEVSAVLAKLDQPLADYVNDARKLIDEMKTGKKPAAEELAKFQQQFKTLEGAMAESGDKVESLSDVLTANSNALSATGEQVLFGLLAAVVVLNIGIWYASRRTISQPIQALMLRMNTLAKGENNAPVVGVDRKDEIGAMALSVEVFRQAALAKAAIEAEADRNRARMETERQKLQAQAEEAASERLHLATSGLADGLRRLSSGDLSTEITTRFSGEFEALRVDFNSSVAQLRQTLLSVSGSVEAIDIGGREISDGASNLSKRTEHQAASLEQTAAALDEITANVKASSRLVDEARGVATQANSSASSSGVVVAKAVEAMSRIEDSSSRISNIIGVIDEIAFQTNLLALNAGVEAARAGEAGRGFAVVAQEVRELAQRSAKAAREIKDLIQNSTNEVSIGVKLVSEAGSALRTIESHIVNINEHMESIAASSREQSIGLGEVNSAVNQMDQTTQQNAAMVEETTAASHSLATEAQALRSLLSGFKLGHGSGDHWHQARSAA